jgi:hypothetical protein
VLSNYAVQRNLNKEAIKLLLYAPEEVKVEVKERMTNGEDVTAAEIRRLKLANDSLKLTSTSRETHYANPAISTNRSHASCAGLFHRSAIQRKTSRFYRG